MPTGDRHEEGGGGNRDPGYKPNALGVDLVFCGVCD